MKYRIDCSDTKTQYLRITIQAEKVDTGTEFQIPIWRPGRYEAANYAKYIRSLTITNLAGSEIPYRKKNASTWETMNTQIEDLEIRYEFYAARLDAGGSYIDEDIIYINFINCLLYNPAKISESCSVSINIPDNYATGTSLKPSGDATWESPDYYTLADSPLLSAPGLTHLEYNAAGVPFHIWIYGETDLDHDRLVSDFRKFSETQIRTMGDFPEKGYHFLMITVPYKLYHGVEHASSTVICLGPSKELHSNLYDELLGISSHELFHAWNILKIRPRELMPYRFNEVPIFNTGFVAEGFTTYLGDLFLARSGVNDENWYYEELSKLFKRHYENAGRLYTSVTDSSIDLWVDGYQASAPHRKSSIYVEGAIAALILDLHIRQSSAEDNSLLDLMRILYHDFAKYQKGYSAENIQVIAEQLAGAPVDFLFDDFIYGKKDTRTKIDNLLLHYGLQITEQENENILERYFGLKFTESNGQWKVMKTLPDSPAEAVLRPDDEIIEVNGEAVHSDMLQTLSPGNLEMTIMRKGARKNIVLNVTGENFFPTYKIEANKAEEYLNKRKNWLYDGSE